MALEAMDILSAWAEDATAKTDRAIKLAVSATVFKLGATEVEITQADIEAMLREYYPSSRLRPEGGIKVTLTRIEDLGEK